MSSVDNPYRNWGMVAAQADETTRAAFIRLTYLHLAGAVFAFAGIEAFLLSSGYAERMTATMMGTQYGWLIVLGGFMFVSWLANTWASSATSPSTQYAGLTLYVIAEAVIFAPLLFLASTIDASIIPTAGILTLMVFGGLTAAVFMTRADLSYWRTGLTIAGFAAMGAIACAILFGFTLGVLFSAAMIVLASGYILYDTSNVLHHYRIGQHVAAALALFAAVALLFWYMIRLVMALQSRD